MTNIQNLPEGYYIKPSVYSLLIRIQDLEERLALLEHYLLRPESPEPVKPSKDPYGLT